MGTFITDSTTPTVYDDKSAAPGVSLRPGWTTDNILTADDANTIKGALLDCRTSIRELGGAGTVEGTATSTSATSVTVITLPVPTDTTYALEVAVVGRKSDGSESLAGRFGVLIGNLAGTVSGNGDPPVTIWSQYTTGATSWSTIPSVSGTNLLLQVQGAAATTIHWKMRATYLAVT